MSDEAGGNALDRLRAALEQPDDELDVAELALIAATRRYPSLDVERYLRDVDRLARRAKEWLGRGRHAVRVIGAINGVLFEEEGYSGNVEDYYNPLNSYLNEVMDRRTGIPITLSILYVAVARRMGQPVEGVALPLHFIVKLVQPRGDVYVDPFRGGQILSHDDCHQQVERAYGAPVNFQESYLDGVPPRTILYRMLNNLKYIYLRAEDYARAGEVVEQMLVVRPDLDDEVRDLGLIQLHDRRWGRAIELLNRYLHQKPNAEDSERVRTYLEQAVARRARLN